MMYGARIRVTGELESLSDLHVGAAVREDYQDDGEMRERAVVQRGVRDGHSGPMIPATSLKGVLRHKLDAPEDALGKTSDDRECPGHAARLWLENAFMIGSNEANRSEYQTHVAIDRTTGAASDSQLFEREMVRAGARFSFAADWLGDDAAVLTQALAPLAAGLSLGKGTSKGHGRIRLDAATLKIARIAPDDQGVLSEQDWAQDETRDFVRQLAEQGPDTNERVVTLKLTCDGPFISVSEIGTTDAGGPRNVALPLRRDGKPWLQPESLIGALRSRASWLAEVSRAQMPQQDRARPDHIPMDDPKLEKALNGARRLERYADAANLSWVERLFGVTGLRAGLRLISLECAEAGTEITLSSNSLDRVTGATREGFLFQRTCYWRPVFKATLAVPVEAPEEISALLCDLKANGLELGHGATKGFGWFEVKISEDANAGEPADA